jgi:hypothetical protein
LRDELGYFVDCISHNKRPINDGHAGLRVVNMLEAANESVRQRGALVHLPKADKPHKPSAVKREAVLVKEHTAV